MPRSPEPATSHWRFCASQLVGTLAAAQATRHENEPCHRVPLHQESMLMTALRQPSPSEQPRVTALSQTSQEVLEAIRQAYTFVESENEAAVFGILATRPDVAAVLLEALPHVASIFGERTPILLMA